MTRVMATATKVTDKQQATAMRRMVVLMTVVGKNEGNGNSDEDGGRQSG
jgi:hypothetical protein